MATERDKKLGPDAGKPAVTRDALNTTPRPFIPASERGVFGADAPDPKAELTQLDGGLRRLAAARARLRVLLDLATAPVVGPTQGPVRLSASSVLDFSVSLAEEAWRFEELATWFEAAVVLEVRHNRDPIEVRYVALPDKLPDPTLTYGPAKLRSRVPAASVLTKQELADW